jgi:hypothetical protein
MYALMDLRNNEISSSAFVYTIASYIYENLTALRVLNICLGLSTSPNSAFSDCVLQSWDPVKLYPISN